MTLLLNILIVVTIIFFSIYRLNKDYKLFYLLLYVYYQGIITSASLTFIERGIYISEQGRDSYFVGANIVFLLFFFLSIVTLELFIKYFDKHFDLRIPWVTLNSKRLEFPIIFYASFGILMLLILNLVLSESPLFSSSVTRFTYWKYSKLSFLRTVFGNTAVFLPFLFGIIYLRKNRIAIFFLLVYIFYLVFIGQKFSPIVRSIYVFFIPWILNSKLDFKFDLLKVLKSYFIPVFLMIFGIVYLKYSMHNPFERYGISSPISAMVYRIFGLQAHLFWGSTEQFVYINEAKSWSISELYSGMGTLMRYFWHGDLAHIEKSIQNGFSFANAYPAILLKVFPLGVAYFFHVVLVGLILAPSVWLFKMSIMKNRILFSAVAFQFFNWTGISFIMGYFNKTVPGILLLFITIALSVLVFKSKIANDH